MSGEIIPQIVSRNYILIGAKGVDYPYYVNNLESDHLTNFSVITVTFINTSEAFARLRFDKAIIKHNDDSIVASYNISTFGAHRNHVMLKKRGFWQNRSTNRE